jgi:glycyl-tRNA synthetase
MAEIEHYVDPEDKRHEKFAEVRDVVLALLDRNVQESGSTQLTKMSVGDAVDRGIIANETLGYFIARISEFLLKIGIDAERLRFRQHMANEMAHYATDCWDAEIENSTGWTECVGCADRAAYDLTVHSERTGHPLVVRQALKEPVVREQEVAEFNKKVLGRTFGKDSGTVQGIIGGMDEEQLVKLKGLLSQGYVWILPVMVQRR